ncbi:MAG: hypothetical protein OXU79_10785, partial [Gemmatimonadota bacterium]|nr:hypothetical protein [Gemmatimonadota bacterium]
MFISLISHRPGKGSIDFPIPPCAAAGLKIHLWPGNEKARIIPLPDAGDVNLNPKKTATRRRDKTLRNRALSTYGKTFFPFTSSDLVYPGNPQS